MRIEWTDGGYLRRIIDVEIEGRQVLLFDTIEEDDRPGAMTVTTLPPREGMLIAQAIATQCKAVMDALAASEPLPLFERRAA
jgi:hypothetical protein